MKFKRYGFMVLATVLAALFHIGCGDNNRDFVVVTPNNNGGNANTINRVANGQFFGISTVFDVSGNGSGRATNLRGDFNLDGNGGIAAGTITFLDHAGQATGAHLGGTYTINPNGLLSAVIGSILGDINLTDGGLIGGLTAQSAAQFANAILSMDGGATSGTAYFVPRGTGLTAASLNGNFVFSGRTNTRVRNRGFVRGILTFDGFGNVTAANLTSNELRASFGGAGDFTLAAPATYTVANNGDFSANLDYGLFTYQLRGAVGASGRLLVTAVISNQASGTWRVKPVATTTNRRARLSSVRAQGTDDSSSDEKLCTLERQWQDGTGENSSDCIQDLESLTDKTPFVQLTNDANTFFIDCDYVDVDDEDNANDDDNFSISGTIIRPNSLTNDSGRLTFAGIRRDTSGVETSFTNTTTNFTVVEDSDGTLTVDVTFNPIDPFDSGADALEGDVGHIFNFEITITDPSPAPSTTPTPSPSPTSTPDPNPDLSGEFSTLRAQQGISGPLFFDLVQNTSSTLVFHGVRVDRDDNPTAVFDAVTSCQASIFNGSSSALFDTVTSVDNECQWVNTAPLTPGHELDFIILTNSTPFYQVGENLVLQVLDSSAQSTGTITIPVENVQTQ